MPVDNEHPCECDESRGDCDMALVVKRSSAPRPDRFGDYPNYEEYGRGSDVYIGMRGHEGTLRGLGVSPETAMNIARDIMTAARQAMERRGGE